MIELADIIAPVAPPPAPPPYEWIALGVALLMLVLFFVLRWWLKRTRAQRLARAVLKRTERELQSGKLDARAAVMQVGRALRCVAPLSQNATPSPLQGEGWGGGEDALNTPPLPTLYPPKGKGKDILSEAAWSEFTQQLNHARFSPHPIDPQQAAQLLAQARQWIGRSA